MPEKCGLDLTLHARFLRVSVFYTLLQTIIILPTSMLRASVSSLVQSSGSKWLWVHAVLVWWITITWIGTVLWITWGGLAYRRRQIKSLAAQVSASREAKRIETRGEEGGGSPSSVDSCKGIKRYRTLMVTNIPPDMRDETILKDYFDYYIQRHHARKRAPKQNPPELSKPRLSLNALDLQDQQWTTEESEVDEVVLVRKLNTIASLRERRQDVLRKLELVLDPFLDDNATNGKTDSTVWDVNARTARLASKILDSHPKRSLACHAVPAPDWTDILWPRLGKTTYRSEFVRGWVVYLGVWAFTLVWQIKRKQSLQGWEYIILFWSGFGSSIGQSAIEAYLTAFQAKKFDPLPIIASAFPTAAPYFASYILLQVAIQPFFEIFRFGVPQQCESFKQGIPANLSVLGGAIMHLFMLLNPLVIPFMVWKRQFTYVYGRLYETNGRRTSIRVLRYSLDALALGQFVLFAFFILNKAKGHAIATGILFAITLIAKLILEIQEADILCPPVIKSNGNDDDNLDDEDDTASEDWDINDVPNSKNFPSSQASSQFNTFRRSVGRWAGSWKKAGASHKPIPFDHVIFSTLDSKIAFDPPCVQDPPHNSAEDLASSSLPGDTQQIVIPHHKLQPWEDIPPYYRSRGYDDQPTYTDGYDDFLWLPRDPLSTLDLDDTVEMRVTLTTTAGGSGQISDLPSEYTDATFRHKSERDTWQDIIVHAARDERPTSPGANSETRLMSTPSNIGSEVNDTFSGTHLFRRHTHKAATALHDVFRRPRATSASSSTGINMETLSTRSRPGPPNTLNLSSENDFPLIARVTTPSAISVQQETEHEQELPAPERTPSGSHISFAAAVGRSPSGRRPSRMRSGHSNTSEGVSPSASLNRNRSLSHLSPLKSRTVSSMSAQQQRLWNEVMEEERLVWHEDQKEEKADLDKEKEEVMKEQDKIRKASTGESGLRRRLTRGNSESSRPRFERAGESERSRSESVAVVETPTDIEHIVQSD
ncbi:uncharacterized protein L201_001250 [Kwoniella dendrophila CBS 6074]|uniref:CSC1/OSCA1-like 7TM region domain-containing protein n=1 Tax=Kwoniella dendrophila CBS 6074 TaxID=1295534 RepID=A0AAX4JN99_9TREE